LGGSRESIVPQSADHRQIARFKSVHDRNFRPVRARLERLAEEIESRSDSNMSKTDATVTERSNDYGHRIPLDFPIMPCLSFIGRQHVVEVLETFFFTNPSPESQRRMFALCGLGTTTFCTHGAHADAILD
jgi:hypothetical protein